MDTLPEPSRHAARVLTYAGTLPLVAAAVGVLIGALETDRAVTIATTYGAIILSFLAGIHWACHLFFAARCPRHLLLTSNLVALLAWVSLWMSGQPQGLVLQILCFLYLLMLDGALRKAHLLPEWFYVLRRNATAIVVGALTVLAVHA